MFLATIDKSKRLLLLSYIGKVRAKELEAGDGFQQAMRHERHPSERQHQSEHCSKRPHG